MVLVYRQFKVHIAIGQTYRVQYHIVGNSKYFGVERLILEVPGYVFYIYMPGIQLQSVVTTSIVGMSSFVSPVITVFSVISNVNTRSRCDFRARQHGNYMQQQRMRA